MPFILHSLTEKTRMRINRAPAGKLAKSHISVKTKEKVELIQCRLHVGEVGEVLQAVDAESLFTGADEP